MAIADPTGRLALALLLAFAVLVVAAEPAGAQLTLGFEPVVTGLSSPLGLVNAGDGSDPLVARSTIIKAVHLTELRLAIDRAQARRSLPPFAWTDPATVPRVTAVRALHVTQMRTALIEAYQAGQRTPPTFFDATLAAGPVRAAHIAELRAAVLALP